jgi:hypothetical protein
MLPFYHAAFLFIAIATAQEPYNSYNATSISWGNTTGGLSELPPATLTSDIVIASETTAILDTTVAPETTSSFYSTVAFNTTAAPDITVALNSTTPKTTPAPDTSSSLASSSIPTVTLPRPSGGGAGCVRMDSPIVSFLVADLRNSCRCRSPSVVSL